MDPRLNYFTEENMMGNDFSWKTCLKVFISPEETLFQWHIHIKIFFYLTHSIIIEDNYGSILSGCNFKFDTWVK